MSDEVNPFGRENMGAERGPYEAPTQSQPPRKGAPWKMIIGIVLGMFLLGLICCGGMAFFGMRGAAAALQAPIDQSIVEMSADAEIAQKLGTPIVSTSTLGVQNYQNNNGNGSAQVSFNAKGPNGAASVKGKVTLTAGTWRAETLTVKFEDGTTVDLPR